MPTNQSIVDAWTPSHVAIGYMLAKLEFSPSTVLAGSALFEVIENIFAETKTVQRIHPGAGRESPINIVADLGANMLGYYIGRI